MPLIGGTTSWVGPLVGAVLLGSLQQIATVTISSAVNLLIVGLLLVGFVIVAPNGIVGLVQKFIGHRPVGQVGGRRIEADAKEHVHEFDDDRCRCCDDAANALLTIDNLGKRFGGFVALDGISLSVKAGERLGLIGPNGSGKSTLVNCICGTLQNEVGSVTFNGHRLNGMSRAPAHPPRALAHVSVAAAVRELQPRGQYARAAPLHGGVARRRA